MNDIDQHITMIKNGVKISYLKWLETLNKINVNTRYSAKDIGYGASSAGMCHLKHYFRRIDADKKETDYTSLCKMRMGTLVHEDIQNAIQYINAMDYKVMCEIPVTYKKVKGHADIVVEIDDKRAMLIDIKTMAAFPWSKKYGHKPDKNPSVWNKLQLGTYSLGLQQDYGYEDVYMYLLNYNKNTNEMRFEGVGFEYEQDAAFYWHDVEHDVNLLIEDPEDVNLITGKGNTPKYKWECSYCPYEDSCPVSNTKE